MVQARRDRDLAEEAFAGERPGEVGVKDLDGDVAVVLEVAGEVDRGHPARPELALDPVAAGQRRRETYGVGAHRGAPGHELDYSAFTFLKRSRIERSSTESSAFFLMRSSSSVMMTVSSSINVGSGPRRTP